MKKVILIFALVAASVFNSVGQTQTVDPIKTEQQLTKNSTTTTEVWTAKDGTKYKVYIGAKGGKYVVRRSSKTGELYKYYLPKE